jgi:hypothetical protein
MTRKLAFAVAAGVLALGAGVAFGASQSAALTSACVNDTNGLMRAADTCREGEHHVSVGGGGGAVTQNGSFTVAANATGGAKTLPLTDATLSGRCDTFTPPFGGGDAVTARVLVEAPAGTTMDFFPADFNGSPNGVTSKLLAPAASLIPGMGTSSQVSTAAIFTVNGATATLTIGGAVDGNSKACTFLWQAVEVAN